MRFLVIFALAAVLCGCVRVEQNKKPRMAMGVPHGKVKYAPVDATGLVLKVFGNTVFRAGRPASMTFALANRGDKKVYIPEWFSNESDNVGLFIQPYQDGTIEPDEKKWIQVGFDFKQPILHYPVTLMPGNQVLISKPLNVVENMMIRPGEERMFFVKAELTLESLKLASEPYLIRVQSNIQ